jgi:hypothetical protein
LQEVVALIAYEHPEQSPLAQLMQLSQREAVADVLNAAILQISKPVSNGALGNSDMLDSTGSNLSQVSV